MKTPILLTIISLLFSFSLCAQEIKNPIGKWTFKDVHNAEKIDPIALKQLREGAMSGLVIELEESGSYKASIMGQNTTGKWIMNGKVLSLDSPEMPIEFIVFLSTETELGLKLGEGEFIMEKK